MSQVQEDDQSAQVSLTIPECTQSVCSGKDCVLKGRVNGVLTNVLVDTGVVTTVLSKDIWDCARDQGVQLQNINDQKLVGVQGAPLYLHGRTQIQFELLPERFCISVIVADTPTAGIIPAWL